MATKFILKSQRWSVCDIRRVRSFCVCVCVCVRMCACLSLSGERKWVPAAYLEEHLGCKEQLLQWLRQKPADTCEREKGELQLHQAYDCMN